MATQGKTQQAPLARTEDLRIQDLGDEIVVYDTRTDEAHCLGPSAASVWRACDGQRPLADLGEPDETAAALAELADKRLLLERAPGDGSGISRRQLVGRMATAAVAAPLIVSVTAPTAHAQASCFPNGRPCDADGQCCSGHCVQVGQSFVCSTGGSG